MQRPEPVFSVVVPTHDRPRMLHRAVQSVLTQSFGDFELIVADDASDEPAAAVLEDFKDSRLSVLRHDTTRGVAATRNAALRVARGTLVSFLDDDDELLEGYLDAVQRVHGERKPEVGFTWVGSRIVRDSKAGEILIEDRIWTPRYADAKAAFRGFLTERKIGTNSGITVRRSCFEQIGLFDERLRRSEDADLLIRLVRRFGYASIPEVLVKIHLHDGPALNLYDRAKAEDHALILEKNMDLVGKEPPLEAALRYKVGWLYYYAGCRREGRACFRRLFETGQLRWKILRAAAFFEIFGSWSPRIYQHLSDLRSMIARRAKG